MCAGAGTSVPSCLEDDSLVVLFADWAGLTLLASLCTLDAFSLAAAGDGAFPEEVFALGGQTVEFKGTRPPAVKAGMCYYVSLYP